MHAPPWIIAASLYGVDDDVMRRASMALWLDYSGLVAYAEAAAQGQGPGAISTVEETF